MREIKGSWRNFSVFLSVWLKFYPALSDHPRMCRLVWTFAARIGDKYQIRLARPKWKMAFSSRDIVTRGEYRFTVYIENQYLRIDICIESNVCVSKKILIIQVNGQKIFIQTENPAASPKIARILCNFKSKCTIYYQFLCFDYVSSTYYVNGLLYWRSILSGRTAIGSAKFG